MKKIYIIAGEPSGDFLGSSILEKLKQHNVEIHIIGGRLMESHGFKSLFDISEISIGGIFEVASKIFLVKKLLDLAARDIIQKDVDLVLTIDSPGFNTRLAKRIKKSNKKIKLVHFVAPSVWAWRENRSKSVAKIFDRLLTLFDFEPKYFIQHGLQTDFVGHPAIQNFVEGTEAKEDLILLMPGSRAQEIKKLLPIFIEAVRNRKEKIILPTLPHLVPLIKKTIGDDVDIVVETSEEKKQMLFQKAKFAIVSSGTATLQLALCGCPMVACYKVSNITFGILKHLVRTNYITLPNIILNSNIVPELLQKDCTADNIKSRIENEKFSNQIKKFKDLRGRLSNGGVPPSEFVCKILLDTLQSQKA